MTSLHARSLLRSALLLGLLALGSACSATVEDEDVDSDEAALTPNADKAEAAFRQAVAAANNRVNGQPVCELTPGPQTQKFIIQRLRDSVKLQPAPQGGTKKDGEKNRIGRILKNDANGRVLRKALAGDIAYDALVGNIFRVPAQEGVDAHWENKGQQWMEAELAKGKVFYGGTDANPTKLEFKGEKAIFSQKSEGWLQHGWSYGHWEGEEPFTIWGPGCKDAHEAFYGGPDCATAGYVLRMTKGGMALVQTHTHLLLTAQKTFKTFNPRECP